MASNCTQVSETTLSTNPRQFGAIRNEPGNLCLRKTAWWGWEDLNLQPNDYQRILVGGCLLFPCRRSSQSSLIQKVLAASTHRTA